MFGLRVADKNGVARIHHIISGLDYIIGRFQSQIETRGRLSSLAVMSMSGRQSQALTYALFSFANGKLSYIPLPFLIFKFSF